MLLTPEAVIKAVDDCESITEKVGELAIHLANYVIAETGCPKGKALVWAIEMSNEQFLRHPVYGPRYRAELAAHPEDDLTGDGVMPPDARGANKALPN